jgi:replication-associated recombination protein RarA
LSLGFAIPCTYAATADVQRGLAGPVTLHLRDAHYPGARRLGHGRDYRYAHDYPHGVVDQQYAPDAVAGREYYQPSGYGAERVRRRAGAGRPAGAAAAAAARGNRRR